MRRPLAALLLTAAALAALAVPDGASTSATWTHQTLRCATGPKSATVTLKWVPGAPIDGGSGRYVQKGWYDNPCAGQWLLLFGCMPGSQSDCYAVDVAPKHRGKIDQAVSGELQAGPTCDDHGGTASVDYVPAKKAPSCPTG
ncbi:MAG: hypothetical protein QOI86_3958 [Actinomycetota bacterium]|nr:hypothetical protein [Actinomycetota bacterium]